MDDEASDSENSAYGLRRSASLLPQLLDLRTGMVIFMGDKSPKAKDKAKKQDKAGKPQKPAGSDAKKPAGPPPKGK